MNEEKDGPRIARYVAGRCTPEDADETRRWAARDVARTELVNALLRVWKLVCRVSFVWDVDEAWRTLGLGHAPQDVNESDNLEPDHSCPLSRTERGTGAEARNWAMWRAAAVGLVACAILAGVLIPHSRRSAVVPLREIATRRGQRAKLHLADGTMVELGVASRIRYAQSYGRKQRDVYLEGEAYFEVAPDPRHPFAVHTSNAVMTDRGTKFDVRAYPGTSPVEVVVVEGAVDMSGTLLGAADLGRLDRGGALRVQHGVDTAAWLGWRNDRLVFHDTPLRDALAQLGRWYDADLQLGDSALGNYPLTASLHGEPLSKVLDLITAALHVRVARRGTTILLYRRPAP